MNVCDSVLEAIGHTPLVRMRRVAAAFLASRRADGSVVDESTAAGE